MGYAFGQLKVAGRGNGSPLGGGDGTYLQSVEGGGEGTILGHSKVAGSGYIFGLAEVVGMGLTGC